jgi:hypothetical protein
MYQKVIYLQANACQKTPQSLLRAAPAALFFETLHAGNAATEWICGIRYHPGIWQ